MHEKQQILPSNLPTQKQVCQHVHNLWSLLSTENIAFSVSLFKDTYDTSQLHSKQDNFFHARGGEEEEIT